MNGKYLILLVLLIIGIAYISSEYELLAVEISGELPEAIKYPTYIESDTVPCTGKSCTGSTCSWPVNSMCYRVVEGDNIVLRSPDLVEVFNRIYYTCPNGAYDPNPLNGIIEAKCFGYCIPEAIICNGDILMECNVDGTDTIDTFCRLGCENVSAESPIPACTLPHAVFGIILRADESYLYGKDASVKAHVIVNDNPHQGTLVNAKLLKNNDVISEAFAYSDENGVADLIFVNVGGVGEVQIIATATHIDKEASAQSTIYFVGETLVFTSSTHSYIQYPAKAIEFTVNVRDIRGSEITPSIGILSVISTMSTSEIISNEIEYIGNGNYKISSVVSGPGIYYGKVQMNYYGMPFDSTSIKINVNDNALEIGTSDITPASTIGSTEKMRFTVSSSIGGLIDPDAVEIVVSYPSGYITDTLTLVDMTRVEEGIYEFDYTFTEVEKYSFDIYVDRLDYVRGHAKATVSVTGDDDQEDNWLALLISNVKMLFIMLILIASIYVIYKKRR